MGKTVVAGVNVQEEKLAEIANKLGCGVGAWPMNYLGLPLGGNPNKSVFWEPVKERISRRLEGWFKGCLSRGGRLVLLQSVLGSIPIYYLSLFKVPVKVANEIEKLMRDYFWSGRGEGKSDHLVKWEVVSRPKKQGGLGVGNLIKKNSAMLGKWLWRFPRERNSLWHVIIKSKYGLHANGWDSNGAERSSSRCPWRSIYKGWDVFAGFTKFKVGNGEMIRFWEDVWVGNQSLQAAFPRLYRLSENKNMSIQSLVSQASSGQFSQWNLMFSRNFSDRDCDEFTSLLEIIHNFHLNPQAPDKRVWDIDSSGEFSCKSLFEKLAYSPSVSPFQQYKIIWGKGIPTKVKVFAWLASLGKVNTCDKIQLKRPNTALSPSWCCLCKRAAESIDHILLHCDFVSGIWVIVKDLFGTVGAFPLKWADVIAIDWFFGCKNKVKKSLWRFVLIAVAWLIWLERNSRVFENRSRSASEIWTHVQYIVGLWATAAKFFDCTDAFMFRLNSASYLEAK